MGKVAGAQRLSWRTARASGLLTLGLALLACGGGGGSDSSVPRTEASVEGQESPSTVSLSGKLEYEFVPPRNNCQNGLDYGSIERRPIRGATVQLIDANTNALIDSAVSSESGSYSFELGAQRRVLVRVRAELKQAGSPSWDVEVRDNTSNTGMALAQRPLYVLDSSPFETGPSDRTLNLTAATGWDGTSYANARAAAPFAILDTIYASISLVASADAEAVFPPLDVFWSVNNSTVKGTGGVNNGEIGTSYYDPRIDSLFLLGKADDDTEEFDSHVIAHEWGHYFEDNFSRSDSMGGPHNLGNRLDMRLAFGEGWATAFAGMALNSPHYCDTAGLGQSSGFGIDIERDVLGTRGWFNELSVMSIMYDLWDSQLLDDDGGSIGFEPLYNVFVEEQMNTPAFTSVFSFMTALKSRRPGQAVFINGLLGRENIDGSDIYGSGETNDSENTASPPDVLPIFTHISPDGSTVQLCSNRQYDPAHHGNKLSIFRYIALPINTAARYRITANNADPPTSPKGGSTCAEIHSDPDILLFRRGQLVHRGTTCRANTEELTTELLSPGNYVMSVSEFRFADKNPDSGFSPDRSCFDVSVSPAP